MALRKQERYQSAAYITGGADYQYFFFGHGINTFCEFGVLSLAVMRHRVVLKAQVFTSVSKLKTFLL
jgi:hypothetical protein